MAENVYTGAAIVVCATWLAVSLLAQFRALPAFRGFQFQRVIPEWSFFAPIPGTVDFHLLYRDKLCDGNVTSWTEVPITKNSGCLRVIWNPSLRLLKSLIDLSQLIGATPKALGTSAMQASFPYLAILNWVLGQSHDGNAASTQFSLLVSPGCISRERPSVVFVSRFHPLVSTC
jgi:hypothetical protein